MRAVKLILHAVIGLVTPVEVSGRALFRVKLVEFGVDVEKIPQACSDELADQAITVAKKASRLTGHLQRHVVAQVEGWANMVATVLKTREERFFQDKVGPEFRSQIVPVLKRYGITVPPP